MLRTPVGRVRLRSLRACGEFVAVMIGLAGASVCMALTMPPRVAAPPIPHDALRTPSVGLLEGGEMVEDIMCTRAYSTTTSLQSAVEVFDRPADLVASAGERAQLIELETAVCFAEEHYLGDGQAYMAHFEIDERLNAPMWVIMGRDGEVVVVAARK